MTSDKSSTSSRTPPLLARNAGPRRIERFAHCRRKRLCRRHHGAGNVRRRGTRKAAVGARGRLHVTPSIIDPAETPPFSQQPIAEFAKGIFAAQRDLSRPLHATRIRRRTAYYRDVGSAWLPVDLSFSELVQTRFLASPAARQATRAADSAFKFKRVSTGEAEAAAVAVTRDWTLWSDDAAIVSLLAALHPGHPVERISGLLVRAAREGLLPCQEAADLYNDAFKGVLGLWTNLTLSCEDDSVVIR